MGKETENRQEENRIKALKEYHILDTLSQKEFEDITLMASIICDVPIALISFVDQERQWFKSHKGLDVSETHREYSFCSHAINTVQEPFIVKDSRVDPRFKNNPLVTGDPNIVFYAGIPLVNKNGHGLGTVCVIDREPRELTENQITALRVLSDQVIHLMEINKLNYELTQQTNLLKNQYEVLDSHGKNLEYELNQNISEGLREVASQNIRLEKMNKELQAFAYISSHDLQEPLRKIQTFISLITAKELSTLSEKGKEYFFRINRASVRMSSLIRDLMAYNQTSNSSKIFKTINLSSVIAEVKMDLEEEILKYDATVQLLEDYEVHVIPSQFRQLFHNLISNSLKFSRQDLQPKILIECREAKGSAFDYVKLDAKKNYFKISITDNGVGFENQYSERIFEFFQRLDSNVHVYGTGIGLSTVEKIVEHHRGFIYAEGEIGKGATFCIFLPNLIHSDSD